MECTNVGRKETYEGIYFKEGGVYCTATEDGEVIDVQEALDEQYESKFAIGGSLSGVSGYVGIETRRVNSPDEPEESSLSGIYLGLSNEGAWKEFFGLMAGAGNYIKGNNYGLQVGAYNSSGENDSLQVGFNNVARGRVGFAQIGAVNLCKGNMDGLQVAALWNDSDGKRNDGWQGAIFVNDANGSVKLQASLIGNNADGNANVQASLIVNLANGDVNGWQGTVGVNICNGSLSGAQTAVGFNRTDKNVDGAQACVLWNWAGGDGRIETNYFNSKKNDQRTTWHMNGWQGAVLGNSAFGHVDGALTSVLYNMINGVNGEYGVNDGFEFGIINYLGGSESKHLPIIRFFTDDRTAAQKARAKAQVEYDKAIKEYEEKWRKYDDYGWRSHNCKRPIRPDPNDYFGDKTNPTMP